MDKDRRAEPLPAYRQPGEDQANDEEHRHGHDQRPTEVTGESKDVEYGKDPGGDPGSKAGPCRKQRLQENPA